ncbi:hypothetical protein KUTeg_002925 [Tegillarca granosa]|uniref:Uncharacterized protein n=1 Tax=Tegillarca granosa TaxID=220873 RepID=A0ABQ9FQJ8_TEGGR|nr:hypothetical protein KUTeg_002925 [Tegillarca granosa]
MKSYKHKMNEIIFIVIVITFLNNVDCVSFSTSTQDWINATSMCKLAGYSVFFDSKSGTYKPDNIENYNISLDKTLLPAWIYAYQQVSNDSIAYQGCYEDYYEDIKSYNIMLNYSGPTECYINCRSQFALQGNMCYCVDRKLFKKIIKKDECDRCSIKCKEKSYYRCDYPSSSYGRNCFVTKSGSSDYANCNEQHHCICLNKDGQKREIPKLAWGDCFRNCTENNEKPAVLIPKSHLKDSSSTYWSGYFKLIFNEWDKVPRTLKNTKCFTLVRNETGNFDFVSKDCKMKIKALCLEGNGQVTTVDTTSKAEMTKLSTTTTTKVSTTTTTPFLMTKVSSTTTTPFLTTTKVSTTTTTKLLVLCLLLESKRRSVEKHNIKGKTVTNINLYSESNLATNGGIDGTQKINPYSGVDMGINNTNEYEIEDYDYLHSKRNYETKTTENEGLYDHTGITLSEDYDRVVLTQKNRDKDDTYDHTGPDMNQGYSTINTFGKVKTGSKKENYKGMINDNAYDHTVPDMIQDNRISKTCFEGQTGSEMKSFKNINKDDAYDHVMSDMNESNGTSKYYETEL